MLLFYILLFLVSCVLFFFSGDWVIEGLARTAKLLGWREFVVAFFVIALAASLPNLFVGILSAFRGIPELSFGDVAGNNLIAMTLAVALAALFAKGGIAAESRAIQTTSLFTAAAAVLPLILVLDGTLSRGDGILLIAFFIFYVYWLFSKKERFTKIYDDYAIPLANKIKNLFKDVGKILFGIIILLIAAEGIVKAASFFAGNFKIPLTLIGILITGVGSTLPEIYFAIISAKKGETWMILGDLMGAVIFPSTLVLGTVALIRPIVIPNIKFITIARLFLLFAAIFFFIFVRSDRKITKREAVFLLAIYITFLTVEILVK